MNTEILRLSELVPVGVLLFHMPHEDTGHVLLAPAPGCLKPLVCPNLGLNRCWPNFDGRQSPRRECVMTEGPPRFFSNWRLLFVEFLKAQTGSQHATVWESSQRMWWEQMMYV